MLVNHYRNGKDWINPHSDKEKGITKKHGVLTLSVGAARTLRIRRRDRAKFESGKAYMDFVAREGYVLQMKGDFQQTFTHEITRSTKIDAPRTSLTFRELAPN